MVAGQSFMNPGWIGIYALRDDPDYLLFDWQLQLHLDFPTPPRVKKIDPLAKI